MRLLDWSGRPDEDDMVGDPGPVEEVLDHGSCRPGGADGGDTVLLEQCYLVGIGDDRDHLGHAQPFGLEGSYHVSAIVP